MILQEYRDWILSQIENPTFEQMSSGGEIIHFKQNYAIGQIKIHELTFNGEDIVVVELLLTNPATEDNEFYLHFELKDLPRAKELFQDMLDVLNDLKSRQTKKICSAVPVHSRRVTSKKNSMTRQNYSVWILNLTQCHFRIFTKLVSIIR